MIIRARNNKLTGTSELKISICHLYPDLLNIYGDMGNILAIKNRLKWRDIEVEISEVKTGDRINYKKHDIYFIGGGQDQQQIMASLELQRNKEAIYKAAIDNDAVFLAICGGYQLLGHYYQPLDGDKLIGVGLLDAYTVAGETRFIGNVTARAKFLRRKTIVGFENHSGLTYLNKGVKPFVKVSVGRGNNGKDKTEGARYKNVFGTYLHGPILPKNPEFCDYLISLALKKKYACEIPLLKLKDDNEIFAHKDRVNAKY